MTQPISEHTYNDLVNEIRLKDRRFRFFQGLFITVVLVGLIVLGVLALKQLETLNEQAQIRSKNLNLLIADNQRQTEYIKCIARFFNERNRVGANLTDLDQCVIQRSDGTFSPPDNIPPDTQATSSTSVIQVLPAPTPGSVTVVTPEPQPTIVVPVPENPVTPPAVDPEREPVEVLGIPVCVPLTDVCVRR